MFLVDAGLLEVLYGENVVAKLSAGKIFGEISLMYNCPRTATVRSIADGRLWVIDRSTFRSILIQDSIKKREKYEAFLRGIPLFSALEPYERAKIADALEPVTFQAGKTILKQGDVSDDRFFVIESGDVVFWKEDESAEAGRRPALQSATCSVGGYFGELSLISACPRQATVVAKTDVVCLTMSREDFSRVMGPCEAVLLRSPFLRSTRWRLVY